MSEETKHTPFRDALEQAVLQGIHYYNSTEHKDISAAMNKIAAEVAEDYPIEDAAPDLLRVCEQVLKSKNAIHIDLHEMIDAVAKARANL